MDLDIPNISLRALDENDEYCTNSNNKNGGREKRGRSLSRGERSKEIPMLDLETEIHGSLKSFHEDEKKGFFARLSPRKRSRSRSPVIYNSLPTDIQIPKTKLVFHVRDSTMSDAKANKVLFVDCDGIKVCYSRDDLTGQCHPFPEILNFKINKDTVKWVCRGVKYKFETENSIEEEIQQVYLEYSKQEINGIPNTAILMASITHTTSSLEISSALDLPTATKKPPSCPSSPSSPLSPRSPRLLDDSDTSESCTSDEIKKRKSKYTKFIVSAAKINNLSPAISSGKGHKRASSHSHSRSRSQSRDRSGKNSANVPYEKFTDEDGDF